MKRSIAFPDRACGSCYAKAKEAFKQAELKDYLWRYEFQGAYGPFGPGHRLSSYLVEVATYPTVEQLAFDLCTSSDLLVRAEGGKIGAVLAVEGLVRAAALASAFGQSRFWTMAGKEISA